MEAEGARKTGSKAAMDAVSQTLQKQERVSCGMVLGTGESLDELEMVRNLMMNKPWGLWSRA